METLLENKIPELLNEIYKMEGNSLIEKILDYCETFDIDVKEIGDLLEESENFKNILYRDCVLNNIIKDKEMRKHLNKKNLKW